MVSFVPHRMGTGLGCIVFIAILTAASLAGDWRSLIGREPAHRLRTKFIVHDTLTVRDTSSAEWPFTYRSDGWGSYAHSEYAAPFVNENSTVFRPKWTCLTSWKLTSVEPLPRAIKHRDVGWWQLNDNGTIWIDLGQPMPIHTIRIHIGASKCGYVTLAKRVTVFASLSNRAVTSHKLGELSPRPNSTAPWYTVSTNQTINTARYLRFFVENAGEWTWVSGVRILVACTRRAHHLTGIPHCDETQRVARQKNQDMVKSMQNQLTRYVEPVDTTGSIVCPRNGTSNRHTMLVVACCEYTDELGSDTKHKLAYGGTPDVVNNTQAQRQSRKFQFDNSVLSGGGRHCYMVLKKPNDKHRNRGKESTGYLRYIIENYDSLPKYVAFTHAGKDTHWHDYRGKSKTLAFEESVLMRTSSVNDSFIPFVSRGWCEGNDGDPRTNEMQHFWDEQLVKYGLPRVNWTNWRKITHYCCAQFVVSRSRIRARPLSMYKSLEQYVLREHDDYRTTRELEHTWHMIFGEQAGSNQKLISEKWSTLWG